MCQLQGAPGLKTDRHDKQMDKTDGQRQAQYRYTDTHQHTVTVPEVGHHGHYHRDNIACTRSQIPPSFCDVTGRPYFDKIVFLSLKPSSCHTMNDSVASSVHEKQIVNYHMHEKFYGFTRLDMLKRSKYSNRAVIYVNYFA